MTITPPDVQNLRADVVDNNVLLYWQESRGTLPIQRYSIFKGATYQAAEAKGQVTGTFVGLFETLAGTYTYWVVAEDTAGNRGTPQPITLRVSQPPDFVLVDNGTIDPREAMVATNIFIEGFGFAGGAVGAAEEEAPEALSECCSASQTQHHQSAVLVESGVRLE